MLLHTKTIPDPIQKAIYSAIERDWEGAIDSIENVLEMDKILAGTDWMSDKGSFAPDVFAGMNIPDEPKPMKLMGKPTKKVDTKEQDKVTKNLNNLF